MSLESRKEAQAQNLFKIALNQETFTPEQLKTMLLRIVPLLNSYELQIMLESVDMDESKL